MRHSTSSSCRRLALCLTLAACSSIAAASDRPGEVRNEGFYPRLARYGVVAPVLSQDFELRVVPVADGRDARVVAKSAAGTSRTFELSRLASQVEKLWVVDGRLVVVSATSGAGPMEVAIFDIESGRAIDAFLGYSPVPSPDGRRVAFERFYPAHFAEGVESQYRLFDVLASPAANRPSYRKGAAAPVPTEAGMFSPFEPVGVALYPLSAAELNRPNVGVPAGQAHNGVSKVSWSPDGNELAFVDVLRGKTSVVLIDTRGAVEPGAVRATVARVPQLESLCHVHESDDCVNASLDEVHLKFDSAAVTIEAVPGRDAARRLIASVERREFRPVAQARYGLESD